MKRYWLQIIFLLVVFLLTSKLTGNYINPPDDFYPVKQELPIFYRSDTAWVDSIMGTLSLDEKIAQLLMVAAYSNRDENHKEDISEIIKKYTPGGLIFFQGGPVRQVNLINHYQNISKVPLLIAMDAENGPGMRLDSCISYPRQMMLGSIRDEALLYQMGFDIGQQLKLLGVHVNFAPVVDINNNPANPVINNRSFGEDRMNVARKSFMYAQGLQDAGILAVFKHFPGHGDTDADSHYSLPVIKHTYSRLDSLELFPFKVGVEKGIPGIMSAHLSVPALDSTENLASSLSPKIIQNLLKDRFGYTGLVFTDALNMKGASNYFQPGEVEVKALLAGNDVLLMPSNIPKAIHAIRREIKKGNFSEHELEHRCRKILYAKSWAGHREYNHLETDSLYHKLNDPFYEKEKRKLIRNSITLLRNRGRVLPLYNLESYKIASLSIGTGEKDDFSRSLKLYAETDALHVSKKEIGNLSDSLNSWVKNYNTLIVSVQNTSQWPQRDFGLTQESLDFLEELDFPGNKILSIFGNPYMISGMDVSKFDAVLMCYDDEDVTKELAAQALFGAFSLSGVLPVSADSLYRLGSGVMLNSLGRLQYGFPEEAGLDSRVLKKIDTIALEAIRNKATPGCQVLVARKGRVVVNKAYGFHTYQKKRELSENDIFDLASITKITATLPSLMLLDDQGRFNTDDELGKYFHMHDTCNKRNLLIRDILTHQAGLRAWIPFYYMTLEPMDTTEALLSSRFSWKYPIKLGSHAYAYRNIKYIDSIYEKEYSEDYPIKVAEDLFLRKYFRDSIYRKILDSELGEKEYKYSDLGYYFFHRIIEEITDTSLYSYVFHNFFSKMGAGTMGYLPLNRFSPERIVPTENDLIFRRQLLRGYVHDPGAAMLGGVAGHAGVFSNANDLAKMMQMYLNGGIYGNRRFLSEQSVQKYTARVYSDNGNRRGLGFDKPEPDEKKNGPSSKGASLVSYGHTGFTGTMAWVDPEYDLIFIFLSNRIHPDQYNLELIKGDVRTRMQQVIYDAVIGQK